MFDLEYQSNPIILDNQLLTPTEKATHVGVVRSPSGNGFALSDRLSAHKRSIFSLLHSGIAKSHLGNPCASLRVESCYATPVLLSGLATLSLTFKEVKSLSQHYKLHIEKILKPRNKYACPLDL